MGVWDDLGVGGLLGGVFMGGGVGIIFKYGGRRGGVLKRLKEYKHDVKEYW